MCKLGLFLLLITSIMCSCNADKSNKTSNVDPEKKDTVLLYIDTAQIFHFFKNYPLVDENQQLVKSFYQKRNYALAWISNFGINEAARHFINLLNQEEITKRNDSLLYFDNLFNRYQLYSQDEHILIVNDSLAIELDLLLTINFFNYAKRNWAAANMEELEKVSWFIAPKKINYEHLLDSMLKRKGKSLAAFEPVYRQFDLLKKYLLKYNEIEKNGGWDGLSTTELNMRIGDTSFAIISIKKELYLMEDLKFNDTTNVFNDAFTVALKSFQNRHGLNEDGSLNKSTLQELNNSVHQRIQQILINMERSRWVPAQIKGDYLAVNIPEFKLHVYHNDKLLWSCNVVVGKTQQINNTVIFNDTLEYIVFSPYWNVSHRIITKEVIPAIKRNSNYLVNHNMEVVTYEGKPIASSLINWNKYTNNFPYMIREKPGKNNSLGLVKFLFPNAYDIYLHDTPSKSLFNETSRTFSHGCIRIEQPYKLAQFLLKDDSIFTEVKINSLMNGGKQTFVKLNKKVPVFIAYFTAWVDRNGKLNFRDDIYHHDEKMKQLMFTN